MSGAEDAVTRADRHVREGERHVAHQLAIIDHLERDGHFAAAELARKVLSTLEQSLAMARTHLRMEREEARRTQAGERSTERR